jgi:hypothetical protein
MALMRDPSGPESYVTDAGAIAGDMLVDTTTLDSYLETQQWPDIHLIKMNIEAGEFEALGGMRETSRRNPQLRLVMEFNPKAMDRARQPRAALADRLGELGFRQSRIVELGMKPVAPGELLPKSRAVYNLYLTKD